MKYVRYKNAKIQSNALVSPTAPGIFPIKIFNSLPYGFISVSYVPIPVIVDAFVSGVDVVIASKGYPVSYEKGIPMKGFEKFDGKDDYFCFHAGTKFEGEKIVTNGGRVLGITAIGNDLKEARAKAYEACEWVSFDNKYMRHDIGKAIDEA